MAPPFLIASLRSASSARAEEIRSKEEEEGKASRCARGKCWSLLQSVLLVGMAQVVRTFFKRHVDFLERDWQWETDGWEVS